MGRNKAEYRVELISNIEKGLQAIPKLVAQMKESNRVAEMFERGSLVIAKKHNDVIKEVLPRAKGELNRLEIELEALKSQESVNAELLRRLEKQVQSLAKDIDFLEQKSNKRSSLLRNKEVRSLSVPSGEIRERTAEELLAAAPAAPSFDLALQTKVNKVLGQPALLKEALDGLSVQKQIEFSRTLARDVFAKYKDSRGNLQSLSSEIGREMPPNSAVRSAFENSIKILIGAYDKAQEARTERILASAPSSVKTELPKVQTEADLSFQKKVKEAVEGGFDKVKEILRVDFKGATAEERWKFISAVREEHAAQKVSKQFEALSLEVSLPSRRSPGR